MKALEVENLNFDYSDTSVLNNLSFSIDQGDFLGIIGSNGAGKSTLIKLILGILPYKQGIIKVFGKDIKKEKHLPELGYVSQKAASFNLQFPATVKEVVMSNLYSKVGLFKPYKKEHMDAFYEAINQVGMTGYENKLIGKLSGGQQQRVFIARALISKPKILFLDEPTVGIDTKTVDEISKLILELNKKGMTIVMTNHDTKSLMDMSNKLLVLSEDKTEFAKI